ncbi:Imm26 family immunity protein [Psychrobacillus sp.]|uniref:Imm26 family immunity protein n=1 Tax=Psychrobacillus sp. TaxID=1871623 RepID=UPI0028BD3043|nr:Imm26 family immunity protein [Psychrobacillus sp.]
MARRKKIKVSFGDLFTIPGKNELMTIGQVVYKGSTSNVFIIFDCVYKQGESINEIKNNPILFIVNTVDTKLEDSEWKVVVNKKISEALILRIYIAETLDGFVVLDAGRKIIRHATENDVKCLSTLTSVSPVILEDAVKLNLVMRNGIHT